MKIEERINIIIDEKEQFQLKALRLEAENKRLKEVIIKALKDTIIRLKKEYDMLDAIIDMKDAVIDKLKAENDKLKSCLQEIKAIAETPKPFIDNLEIKSATEVGYDYAAICNELELRLHKVLELITKAESEG